MSYLLLIILFLLPILYEGVPAFRYHFKTVLYYVLLSIHSLCLIPIFIFRGRDVQNLVVGTRLTRWITLPLGLRWTLKHGERLQEKSSCIIISNHQHSLDILGMFQNWPDHMTVVAKRGLLFAGPFGLAAWLCKLMFIDRRQGNTSRQMMAAAMRELVRTGTKLWIFPEGTRRNKNKIHDFKKGAFYLAIQHQIPLQPLVYSSYTHFLNNDKSTFDNGEIILTALPRISTEGLTEADIPQLIEKTKKLMEQVYAESTEEALARFTRTPLKLSEKLEQKLKVSLGGGGNGGEKVASVVNEHEDIVKDGILHKAKPALEKTIN